MRAPPSSWKQGHQLRPRMSGLRERRDGRVGRLIDKRERGAFPGPPEVWTLNLKAVLQIEEVCFPQPCSDTCVAWRRPGVESRVGS